MNLDSPAGGHNGTWSWTPEHETLSGSGPLPCREHRVEKLENPGEVFSSPDRGSEKPEPHTRVALQGQRQYGID